MAKNSSGKGRKNKPEPSTSKDESNGNRGNGAATVPSVKFMAAINEQPKNIPRNIFLKDADSMFTFDVTLYGRKKSVVVSQSSAEATFPGGALWEIGVLLSRLFSSTKYSPIHANAWNKVKVLELGAGVGLTGIVTGVLGARQVLLTDLPVVIEGITKKNIALNGSHLKGLNKSLRVSAQSLTWGCSKDETDAIAALGGTFPDLLIAGDVSYQHKPGAPSHFEALVDTVLNTSNKNTIFVFGHRVRMEASNDLLNSFLQHFIYVQEIISAEKLDCRFKNVPKHNITLHVMKRRPEKSEELEYIHPDGKLHNKKSQLS